MIRILVLAQSDLANQLDAVLSRHGYSTICCSDPQQALCKAITFRPQLVLAELLEIDGDWLCREIRKLRQLHNTQVIMMSAAGQHIKDKDLESMALACGANGYLRKPFPYCEIANFTKSWLQAS